jgi:predicted AAA+ superfamily ATPase
MAWRQGLPPSGEKGRTGFDPGADVGNRRCSRSETGRKNIEIQQLPGWSRVLRTLHNQNRYHIVVTGSNAGLLEREMATELRGRCRNILMMPFSFPEFLRFHGIPDDERTLLTPARGGVLKAFAIEEGFILTNDEERELTFEGAKIQVMPVWKWLFRS